MTGNNFVDLRYENERKSFELYTKIKDEVSQQLQLFNNEMSIIISFAVNKQVEDKGYRYFNQKIKKVKNLSSLQEHINKKETKEEMK